MILYPHDAEIKSGLTAQQVVALTIWAEARAEDVEGEIAVGCVIRNRLLHPKRFGETWAAVCLAKWQFSCWIPQGGEANYRMVMATAEAKRWPRQQMWIADGLISGELEEDRVKGATHYYASWMATPPTWAAGLSPTAIIGAHRFYKAA